MPLAGAGTQPFDQQHEVSVLDDAKHASWKPEHAEQCGQGPSFFVPPDSQDCHQHAEWCRGSAIDCSQDHPKGPPKGTYRLDFHFRACLTHHLRALR